MPRRITIGNWIIIAIRKHIEPEKALSGAAVGVCVEEALHNGIVISALEVIEARLFGLSVAIEAKRRSIKLPKKNPQVGDKT